MLTYGVFFGPLFPEFGQNTGKYGPEKTPYLDTFHALLTLGDVNAKKWLKQMFWENSNPFDGPERGKKITQILFPACLYAILFVTTLKRDRVQYFGKVAVNTVLMGAK